MSDIIALPAWKNLQQHQQQIKHLQMRTLFQADPNRFKQFSLAAADILVDYSKNRITSETLQLLIQLANGCHLAEKITAMLNGNAINQSENRAVLHTALRRLDCQTMIINGENIIPGIKNNLAHMLSIAEKIRQGEWRGYTNKPITDIVNIGIGGSDLGPLMAIDALTSYVHPTLKFHFISNIDANQTLAILNKLNPETSLFIIASKSFTTSETLHNAELVKRWFVESAGAKQNFTQHFLASTANTHKAIEFGIAPQHILALWDWVGGRYSLWTSIGLPIAIAIGVEQFKLFLEGAAAMDEHFITAPFAQNMPVVLGLLGIWYINFFAAQTHAVLPYDFHLKHFPAYLQQLDMESNGKNIQVDGSPVTYHTGPVVWGGVGVNGQHAFHQLLHQGTHLIPVDFIIAASSHHHLPQYHDLLFANCLSQSQALMQGKDLEQVVAELLQTGMSQQQVEKLAPHKVIPGNRPSNTLVFPKLTPAILGALIALYEHKTFVQGAIWHINSFDQWGVELGKQLADKIIYNLQHPSQQAKPDASTDGLIQYYHQHKK